MKKLVLITALMCGASSLVMAQTATPAMNSGTATSGSTVTGTPSATTSLNGSSGTGTVAAPMTGPTGVNNGPGAAQTTGQTATMGTPTNPPTTGNAMGTTTNVAPAGQAATGTSPLKGANSFTKKEALHRLAANGYTHVTGLAKDSQSVWRGTGMKNGQRVSVALDYRGNITEGTAGAAGSAATTNNTTTRY